MYDSRIKIGIIEDSAFLTELYKNYFLSGDEFDILFQIRNLRELDNFLENEFVFDLQIILIELLLKADLALDHIPRLEKGYPAAKVLVVSGLADSATVDAVFRAGADGFVSKRTPIVELPKAMKDLLTYGSVLSPDIASIVLKLNYKQEQSGAWDTLSAREQEIALSAVQGRSYKEIAHELFISTYTVNYHLKNIYKKLGVSSKAELTHLLYTMFGNLKVNG